MRRIDVVLVRSGRPGNIGAAARAMKNLGAERLILVGGCPHRTPAALRMAYGAQELLTRAKRVRNLAQAVASHRLVIGTTVRQHKGYGPPAPLAAARRSIMAHARRGRVALVFGSEQNGLTNDELAHCRRLVRLPMASPGPSYNLGQAVLLVLYELYGAAHADVTAPTRLPARSADLERLYAQWAQLLADIGFLKGAQGRHILADVRRIFGRAGPDDREVRILRGILRQIQWHRARPRAKARAGEAAGRKPSGGRTTGRARRRRIWTASGPARS